MGGEVVAGRPGLPLLRHRHDPLPHVAQVPLLAHGVGGGELNMYSLEVARFLKFRNRKSRFLLPVRVKRGIVIGK